VYNSVVALATKSPTRITSPRIVTWETSVSYRERPRRRAAEQRDELAALYLITSSAAISSLSGIVMPRRPLACQATKRRNGTRGPALLGGEAIEQPVAAGAAQVGLATAAIGPARGMR
jgi:hypothetical protein